MGEMTDAATRIAERLVERVDRLRDREAKEIAEAKAAHLSYPDGGWKERWGAERALEAALRVRAAVVEHEAVTSSVEAQAGAPALPDQ